MASLNLELIYNLEFGNDPEKFLHKHRNETGYTLGGVYQTANPYAIDWSLVSKLLSIVDIKRASVMLYYDHKIQKEVYNCYMNNYFKKMKLDKVNSQKIADEILSMGIVAGTKTSAKIAQRIVGVVDDGIIGNKTLASLNFQNEDEFDKIFDEYEIDHFKNIALNNNKLERFLNGWKNRAVAV